MTALTVTTGALEYDTFARTVSNDWGSPTSGDTWFRQFGDAAALNVAASQGTVTISSILDGGGCVSDTGKTNMEHVFQVKLTGHFPSDVSAGYFNLYQFVCFADASNYISAQATFYAGGRINWQLAKVIGGVATGLSQLLTPISDYVLGDLIWMKTRRVDGVVSGKLWRDGTAEPAWFASPYQASLPSGTAVAFRVQPDGSNTNTATFAFQQQHTDDVVAGWGDTPDTVQVPNRDSIQLRTQLMKHELVLGCHQDMTYDGFSWRRAQGLAVMQAVGAEVSRNSIPWYALERDGYDFADAAISELTAANIRIIGVLLGTPESVSGSADPFYMPTDPAAFTSLCAAWAAQTTIFAERWGGVIRDWEIGNEMEDTNFWRPTPDPYAYAQWYTAIRDALLAVDPTFRVSVGGLTSLQEGGGQWFGLTYLQALMSVGIPMDVVSIHPYSNDAPSAVVPFQASFTADITAMRDALDAGGYACTKLQITEYGWESTTFGETNQAYWVLDSIELLDSTHPYIDVVTYFLDRDIVTGDSDYRFGLYTEGTEEVPPVAKQSMAAFLAANEARFRFDSQSQYVGYDLLYLSSKRVAVQ